MARPARGPGLGARARALPRGPGPGPRGKRSALAFWSPGWQSNFPPGFRQEFQPGFCQDFFCPENSKKKFCWKSGPKFCRKFYRKFVPKFVPNFRSNLQSNSRLRRGQVRFYPRPPMQIHRGSGSTPPDGNLDRAWAQGSGGGGGPKGGDHPPPPPSHDGSKLRPQNISGPIFWQCLWASPAVIRARGSGLGARGPGPGGRGPGAHLVR